MRPTPAAGSHLVAALFMMLFAIPDLAARAEATDQKAGTKQEPGDQKPSVVAHGDDEILGLLLALDGNEVTAAMVALKKDVDEKVLALARSIEKDHSQDRNDITRVSGEIGKRPKVTEASKELATKGNERLRSLRAHEGRAFEEFFVSEMAKGHREALLMLDGFLETAQDQALKSHLNQLRQHVALHLQEAERIKGKAQLPPR